jgi:hypothetical protein
LSRFRVFLLCVAFAALATAFAACGGSSDSSSEDPQKVLDTATLEGVESGDLDLSLNVAATGEEGGNLDLSLSGPFQSEGKGKLPQLALDAKVDGAFSDEDINFEGGLTLLSDKAFVSYEGTDYEVDATTFGFVKSALEQAEQEGAGGGSNPADVTACQEAATGLKVGDFVDNLTSEGSADVDGTDTTKVSGDLNTNGAIDAIIKLTEDPACSAQFEAAGPLPLDQLEAAKGEVGKLVKKAHVDVYVGDDDIIRKLAAELTIDAPEGEEEGVSSVDVDFEMSIGGVNEEQDFSAPSGAKPLTELFQKLDVNPIELLEAGSSGEGLQGLLEGATGGSSGGSSGGGLAPSPADAQKYLECLKTVHSAADLQKCEALE